jgi:hypothetical protein
MTQQAELLQKIDTLPPEYFGEVFDFVGFLQQKARRKTEAYSNVQTASEKWANPLLGLGKKLGATLTLDRFMEMQREEVERENENDKRLWGNK